MKLLGGTNIANNSNFWSNVSIRSFYGIITFVKPDLGYAIQTSIEGSLDNIQYLLAIFQCQNCGRCEKKCTDGIWLQNNEVLPLARELKLTKKAFIQRYCVVKDHITMKEPCVFHKRKRCSIYPIRPMICRLFPIDIDSKTHKIKITCCPGGIDLLNRLNINPNSSVTTGASSSHKLSRIVISDFGER